jgi:hypothetical protein
MRKITIALALCLASSGNLPAAAEEPKAMTESATVAATTGYVEQARDIIFYALSLVGIRYSWGGVSPHTGFDCSGLVSHVYRQIAGLVLPRDLGPRLVIAVDGLAVPFHHRFDPQTGPDQDGQNEENQQSNVHQGPVNI